MCLELRLNGILLFTGAVLVSCFIQSGALESPDVLLSYPITSLSSPMTCHILISPPPFPTLVNIIHIYIYDYAEVEVVPTIPLSSLHQSLDLDLLRNCCHQSPSPFSFSRQQGHDASKNGLNLLLLVSPVHF